MGVRLWVVLTYNVEWCRGPLEPGPGGPLGFYSLYIATARFELAGLTGAGAWWTEAIPRCPGQGPEGQRLVFLEATVSCACF